MSILSIGAIGLYTFGSVLVEYFKLIFCPTDYTWKGMPIKHRYFNGRSGFGVLIVAGIAFVTLKS